MIKKNFLFIFIALIVFLGIVYAVNFKEEEEVKIEEGGAENKDDDRNNEEERLEIKEEIQGNNEEVEKEKEKKKGEISFIDCLKEKEVIIYGSKTCPACSRLIEEFGGYDKIESIYVECTEEERRCREEMLVDYVPAVQINGEVFKEWGSPENLAEKTGCKL